jgi:hypothetical protein
MGDVEMGEGRSAMATSRRNPIRRTAGVVATFVVAAIFCLGAPAAGAPDLTAVLYGRTYLLSGQDTFTLDGREAAPASTYDPRIPNEGPFRVTFDDAGNCIFNNRAFGTVVSTWKPGRGRMVDVTLDPRFLLVYPAFLEGLIPVALRVREKSPIPDEDITITKRAGAPVVDVRVRVSADGLYLTVNLRNVRRYRAILRDADGRPVRRISGVFVERGRFRGPLVQ